jgi:hypothetical protein
MFFIYVYTEAGDNVGDGPVPITVTEFDRRACMNGSTPVMQGLVEDEGLDWDSVTRIEVETEDDPDMDDPETEVCYQK